MRPDSGLSMRNRRFNRAFAVAMALAVGGSFALMGDADARGAGMRGGGSYGRMATTSVGAANRPAQLPAGGATRPVRPVGWAGWGDYGYYYGRDDEIDVEGEQPQQAAAAPAPAAPVLPPSVGSVHTTVPAGCSTVEKDGKFLRSCGGALYAERFEGDRLVYEVVAP